MLISKWLESELYFDLYWVDKAMRYVVSCHIYFLSTASYPIHSELEFFLFFWMIDCSYSHAWRVPIRGMCIIHFCLLYLSIWTIQLTSYLLVWHTWIVTNFIATTIFQVTILCNDCVTTCNVAFHILGLKCTNCSSYNTRRISGGDQQWHSTD